MDRFYKYEENFLNSAKIISRFMIQLEAANGNVDNVISASVEIEGEISEAEGYLRAMEVEFRTLASTEKRTAQQKVTEYKTEYKQIIDNFQTSKYNAESLALKGGTEARTKLLNANQKLDASTATLEQSRNILHQTEKIGDTIITDLESQKEHLVESKEKVKETKKFTVDAKHILRMMGNRALMHKACVMFTILVLAGAIIGIAYYGLVGK